MRFTLEVDMSGKGFERNARLSLAQILSAVSTDAKYHQNGVILDCFGEIVGTWAVIKTTEPPVDCFDIFSEFEDSSWSNTDVLTICAEEDSAITRTTVGAIRAMRRLYRKAVSAP